MSSCDNFTLTAYTLLSAEFSQVHLMRKGSTVALVPKRNYLLPVILVLHALESLRELRFSLLIHNTCNSQTSRTNQNDYDISDIVKSFSINGYLNCPLEVHESQRGQRCKSNGQ